MAFWKYAYNHHWCTIHQLLLVVKTDSNPYGEITKEEYKEITGLEYPKTE